MTDNVTDLNQENFNTLTSKGKWAIDFWAEWCGPCVMLKPNFEAVAKEMKGKINFGKIDIDTQQELAEKFQVMSIPTILLLKNGSVIDSSVGYISKDSLVKKVSEAFN